MHDFNLQDMIKTLNEIRTHAANLASGGEEFAKERAETLKRRIKRFYGEKEDDRTMRGQWQHRRAQGMELAGTGEWEGKKMNPESQDQEAQSLRYLRRQSRKKE